MNIENIQSLINKLKWLKETGQEYCYNQLVTCHPDVIYKHDRDLCGTPSCVAGWAYRLSGGSFIGVNKPNVTISTCLTLAARWLELDDHQAHYLFDATPFDCFRKPEKTVNPTIDDAIAVLEHLLKTGEVGWARFTPTGERLMTLNFSRTDFEKYGESAIGLRD